MNSVYVSEQHGCVYALCTDQDSDGDILIYTPQNADGTYDTDQDNWNEVDEMALLGEEEHIQQHVKDVFETLQSRS